MKVRNLTQCFKEKITFGLSAHFYIKVNHHLNPLLCRLQNLAELKEKKKPFKHQKVLRSGESDLWKVCEMKTSPMFRPWTFSVKPHRFFSYRLWGQLPFFFFLLWGATNTDLWDVSFKARCHFHSRRHVSSAAPGGKLMLAGGRWIRPTTCHLISAHGLFCQTLPAHSCPRPARHLRLARLLPSQLSRLTLGVN